MDYMKLKVSFTASMLESRVLVKLEIFSGEDLVLSLWWRILYEKISVYRRMELVVYTTTDVKRSMRQNTFGVPFPFLYFS